MLASRAKDESVEYSSVKSMLRHGHEALHRDYAERLEKAGNKWLPRVEVSVHNLSLTKLINAGGKEMATNNILHNFSGVFRPGTMTLILGQPGSGKSALLKVLGGRFTKSKVVQMDGEVKYNGAPQEKLSRRIPQFVSYVAQRDRHFSRLTVQETFAFAHECAGSKLSERDGNLSCAGNNAALEASSAIRRHYPEIVIHQLGLESCQDTIVGDAMLRGISGGERKRVTTGEMQFGDKLVTLMDEISTGLDSAVTYRIVNTQRSLAKKLHKTVVMALLQPAPEVFALFDNVIILNEGFVMYHGPTAQVLGYFESLGFVRPQDRDVADFLLDLGTNQQSRYEAAVMTKDVSPRRPQDFAQAFEKSGIYASLLEALHAPLDPVLLGDDTYYLESVPEFHLSFWSGTWAVIKRDFKVTWRNRTYILGRIVVLFLVAMIYASLIYDFDPKDAQRVLGTIFPTILFFALGQTAQLPLFMDARDIFYKQRGANMYRTSSYVVSTMVNQLPIAFIEVTIMGAIAYWICGFVADVWAFLVFELILFTTYLAFVAWYFFISTIAPNIQVAQPIASMSMLIYILFSGFVVVHKAIPDYFVWLYWFNPLAWGVRGMSINEYGHASFDKCVYDNVDYCAQYGVKMGAASLGIFDMYTDKSWIWLGIAYMVFSFVTFMGLGGFVLEHMRFDGPVDAAAHTATNLHGAEGDVVSTSSDSEVEYHSAKTPRVVSVRVASHPRQFTPVTLAFKNLWYSVPDPKNLKTDLPLLKGVSGFATPGTITALMGSSGAGKTTLMDVIAGRKTGGKIQGDILINGHPVSDLAIRRATGYCEQMDIHAEATTFREALTFSAFLRQGAEISDEQKHESVEECLDLLDLRPIADKLVRGSSVEQMKRLTIGVELAAQPSVLFLDEPTSGLDARSAKMVMEGIRNVADTGRTVVCTIHQPSADVFSVFDSLLLLKRGGEMVYFGELGVNAYTMVSYFESIGGVPRLEQSYNPATWMLDIIGTEAVSDFVAEFEHSEKKAFLERKLEQVGVGRPAPDTSQLTFASKRAASNLTQARVLLSRFANIYKRTPQYTVVRVVVNIILGTIIGLTFLDADFATYQQINAGIGMIFTTTVFIGGVSFDSVRPISIAGRDVFYRERASQTYNALWYFLSASLIEIPYVFGTTLTFTSVFFPTVGFRGVERFVLYWFHMSTFVLIQTYLGQLLVFMLPTLEVSATFSILLTAVFFLFAGFNPPASQMPDTHKWIYYLTPPKYPIAILSSLVFGECDSASDVGCQVMQQTPPTVQKGLTVQTYLDSVFEIRRSDMWTNFGAMVLIIFVLRVVALLALRFINHQKK